MLRHPLASALPAQVVDEAERILACASGSDFVAPIHALRLYHQTAHLLGACTDPATRRRHPQASHSIPVTRLGRSDAERTPQFELEFPRRIAVA
ncbi:MAG TPA: hypothetical protein VFV33_10505 [Gemmatimonadaceae bacterium]|nr:hypothetical protein [Gemmatimonadaceae bacterium]